MEMENLYNQWKQDVEDYAKEGPFFNVVENIRTYIQQQLPQKHNIIHLKLCVLYVEPFKAKDTSGNHIYLVDEILKPKINDIFNFFSSLNGVRKYVRVFKLTVWKENVDVARGDILNIQHVNNLDLWQGECPQRSISKKFFDQSKTL